MSIKARAIAGVTGGLLLVVSSAAHTFAGWPQLRGVLTGAGVDPAIVGALAVGWVFGSVSMLAFGVIVLRAGIRMARGREFDRAPVIVIGSIYALFGVVAFLSRALNPHFLLFILNGALVAWAGSGRSDRQT